MSDREQQIHDDVFNPAESDREYFERRKRELAPVAGSARFRDADLVAEAMQDAWNDHCDDTGCFPGFLTVTRGPVVEADFRVSNFSLMVSDLLKARGWIPPNTQGQP